jgi:hypothetical protein
MEARHGTGGIAMRWQAISTDWTYYLPKARRHWLALSDQQLAAINGSYERLVECLQESYGLSTDVVKEDILEWCATFGDDDLRSSLDGGYEPSFSSAARVFQESTFLNERHYPRRPYYLIPR